MGSMDIRHPQTHPEPVEFRHDGKRLAFAIAESAVTAALSACWLLLALAMHMESYDLDPSAPGQPRGQGQLAMLAVGTLASVGGTWILRIARKPRVRLVNDGLVALRLIAVLIVTGFLALDLLDG
ncbi:hypothetical protein ACFY8P_30635 [Streptomyces sp. NPDC012693]|jgi:hypothetical protein|uniref:hypothetical protein n=1 Tax=unclassified Streptomyces TaxID=2593676 RepID=UPI0020305F38|nr:hypothetical protein [Streptomyces sp. MSC1_001]